MTRAAALPLALCALLAGAPSAAQQAPDRSVPPAPGPAPPVRLPDIRKHALSNGLPVWIVELHEVPVVQVMLVVRAGSGADPAGKFGVANLTAEMLDEGAGTRDALQIADEIEYVGADLSVSSSPDASYVSLYVPVARLGDALPVMADVAVRPTFPEHELQRVREELLTALLQAEDDPATLIDFAFPRIVFGASHRYGTLDVGTAASLKGLTAADLRAFHAARYAPANSALVIAGDVRPGSVLPMVESAFGRWTAATSSTAPHVPAAPQLKSREVVLIDKPGAAQSQIRIGWVGVPRSTPDYFALRVLNTILGGAFTSRLNTNLREQHGYSYGAASDFDMRLSPGPFHATAGVQTDKTAEALTEFFKELKNIRQPVPPDELEKAKNFVALRLPRSFETTGGLAAAVSQMIVYDLPENYFATFVDRVRAVSAADVQRAAERYIQPDRFAVVIVGDRKAIEKPVRALDLGPLRVVTIGDVMK